MPLSKENRTSWSGSQLGEGIMGWVSGPNLWNQHNCSDLDHLGTQREPGDNAVSDEGLERCAVGFKMSAPISLSPAKTSGMALLCNGTVGAGHSLFSAIKEQSVASKSASK